MFAVRVTGLPAAAAVAGDALRVVVVATVVGVELMLGSVSCQWVASVNHSAPVYSPKSDVPVVSVHTTVIGYLPLKTAGGVCSAAKSCSVSWNGSS